MASGHLLAVGVNTATTSTGSITVGSPVDSAHIAPVDAPDYADGVTYKYKLTDGGDVEFGTTVGSSSGTVFSRATVRMSKISGVVGTDKINLSGSAQFRIIVSDDDFAEYMPIAYLDTDGTLAANSASKVPSQSAVVTYVAAAISALRNGVSGALDTLAEIATDLGLKMVKSANLSDVASAATAFGNIKQAASTTATGVVELATDAETQTGTDTARAITPANLTAKEASTAQYLANTADRILTTDQANAAGALFALTDGATVNWNMANGFNASWTIAGNRTLANPTNTIVGRTGAIVITTSGSNRTIAFGTSWEAAGGSFPVPSTGSGVKDVLFYWIQSSTSIVITGYMKAVA